MLIDDATTARQAGASERAPARLLPSGDAYYRCWGTDRELLVPEARRRGELWTSRVWPGGVLVDGEIVGTWRRAGTDVTFAAWDRLAARQRNAVETEATALPLPSTPAMRDGVALEPARTDASATSILHTTCCGYRSATAERNVLRWGGVRGSVVPGRSASARFAGVAVVGW